MAKLQFRKLRPRCSFGLFDTRLKPRLYRALLGAGVNGLPDTWKQASFDQAYEAAVKAARSEVIRARTALQYSVADNAGIQGRIVLIEVPVDAGVLKLYRESEGVVQASEPIIDIGDSRKLEVTVEVLSADAVRIKPGMPVLFEQWGADSTLSGTVRIVEPTGFTKVSSLG